MIYMCKDGRLRHYDKDTQKVTSYPRRIMESVIGRPLSPYEDVHHRDGNPLNNVVDNLEVLDKKLHISNHAKKYTEYEVCCVWCNKSFMWSVKSQNYFFQNRNRRSAGPFCSRSCSGKYGKQEQIKRNLNAELG